MTGKKEEIWRLYKIGVPMTIIAEKLGHTYDTVYREVSRRRGVPAGQQGKNADRHLCKTCAYRGWKKTCDYVCKAGESRGCCVEDCDKYKRGKNCGADVSKRKKKEKKKNP